MTTALTTDRYSDLVLTAKADSDLPGLARSAQILLTIPVEARPAVAAESHYQINVRGQGWRPSDMLDRCATDFLAGRPFESSVAQGLDPRTIAALALADLAAGR